MKRPFLLAIVTSFCILFYSQCTEQKTQPENTTTKTNADSSISEQQTDSVNEAVKHYEKHNDVQ